MSATASISAAPTSAAPTSAALQVAGLEKHFGALHVTRDISLELQPGERHALIGPNGAGKTTLINLITGVLAPDRGTIRLGGEDITQLGQAARVKRGLARTFQINQLFMGLSVLDNVMLAIAERTGKARRMWCSPRFAADIVDEAIGLLDRLRLTDVALSEVRELPYGRQRMVEIAITLGLKPKVLLLDEPAAGVPSAESHLILDVIADLPADITVLIIEHDMEVVFRFAEQISVLVAGAILLQGTPDEVSGNAEVRAVYLGEEAHV